MGNRLTASAITTMLDTYLAPDTEPEHAVFHVRLGVAVAELARDSHDIQPVIRTIERTAIESADADADADVGATRSPAAFHRPNQPHTS